MNCTLNISIPVNSDSEDETVLTQQAQEILKKLLAVLPEDGKITFYRNEDRSGKNLLYPKHEGRFGSHYTNKKVLVKDYKESNE